MCGERKRRAAEAGAVADVRVSSTGRGCMIGDCRGTRSCSSSSVARTRGSAWKRSTMRIAQERVGQRDQRHALVVGEVGADHGPAPVAAAAAISSPSSTRV